MSVVVRLPENVYEMAKRIAALEGRQPGELLDDALQHYVQTHRESFAATYENAAKALRAGDLGVLARILQQGERPDRGRGAGTSD